MTGSDSLRVVVTGVSSFVGAHLAAGFRRAGHEVVGTITRDGSGYEGIRHERLRMVRECGVQLRRLDLNDRAGIESAVDAARPELWLQHAGWATDYASPAYDLATGLGVNVTALQPLYERLAAAGCRGVLVSGSSTEYSEAAAANAEADACLPDTAYGLAKLAETLRARQLAREHGLSTRVARVYIPFGPLDAPGKLLPSVVAALLNEQPVDLSPCTQRRDFIHVDDLVQGYLALARDCARAELFDVFNLCSGRAIPLRDFLLSICAELGADPGLLRFGARPMREGEPGSSYGSAAKAERLLGWRAPNLEESVRAYLASVRG